MFSRDSSCRISARLLDRVLRRYTWQGQAGQAGQAGEAGGTPCGKQAFSARAGFGQGVGCGEG
jgi:hypothetical protein